MSMRGGWSSRPAPSLGLYRMRYPLERFRPLLALCLRPRLTGGLLRPRAIANSAGIPFGFSSRWGRHTTRYFENSRMCV